jgi:DNA repair exonuclease SbcCD ATPase subunit
LVEIKELQQYAMAMLKDTGIKARIVKKYVPLINQLINGYLSAMNFFITFELDENFNETIKTPNMDTYSYQSFSEGEKMRINLAILFTWREIARLRNSVSTNLLVMDELFDGSMDSPGVEDFIDIIEELTGHTNVFIISHKSQMFDKFRSVIRFEKVRNFSRIAPEHTLT